MPSFKDFPNRYPTIPVTRAFPNIIVISKKPKIIFLRDFATGLQGAIPID